MTPFLRGPVIVLALGLALISANQASVFISVLIADQEFTRESPTKWSADVSKLRPGDYFVSGGKPTGLCNILIGDKLAVRGHTMGRQTRDALLLGTSFSINNAPTDPKHVLIECANIAGVPLKFPEPPIIAIRDVGILLHGWRFFLHVLLGPGSSLLLLALLLAQKADSKGNNSLLSGYDRVSFAALAFMYSLSLAYVTRFFLSIDVAYTLHAVLRCLLTFVVVSLTTSSSPLAKRANISLSIFSTFGLIATAVTHFPFVVQLYRVLYVTWSIFVIINAFYTWKRPAYQFRDQSSRTILTVAGLFHSTDILSMFIERMNLQYPVFLALLCYLFGRQARLEGNRAEALHASAYTILRHVQADETLSTKFLRSVEQVQIHNPLLRLSAYLDSFCFGRSSEPRRRLERVLDFGYRKDTTRDAVVDLTDGRGKLMLEAMTTGKVVFGVGHDGGQYAIVPVGAHACINLSDDEAREPAFGAEAREVLEFLEPAIRSLDSEFRRTGERSRLPINSLLAQRGLGTFSETVGSIFLDVVGYSRQSHLHNDPFGAFVKGVYFSAIERTLQDLVVREFSRGDELYLCAINGFPGQNNAIEATAQALRRISTFVNSEGDELCSEYGFPRIRLTVGAAAGPAELVVTEHDVTTMGDVVNQAKRLQEAAGTGEILADPVIAGTLIGSDAKVGPPTPRLVKGSTVTSHSIHFPQTSVTNKAS